MIENFLDEVIFPNIFYNEREKLLCCGGAYEFKEQNMFVCNCPVVYSNGFGKIVDGAIQRIFERYSRVFHIASCACRFGFDNKPNKGGARRLKT